MLVFSLQHTTVSCILYGSAGALNKMETDNMSTYLL